MRTDSAPRCCRGIFFFCFCDTVIRVCTIRRLRTHDVRVEVSAFLIVFGLLLKILLLIFFEAITLSKGSEFSCSSCDPPGRKWHL